MVKKIIKDLLPKDSWLYKSLYKFNLYIQGNWTFDVMTSYALLGKTAFFIQIGSNNGIDGDPIFELVNRYKWRGILVEPVPYLFNQLTKNYAHLSDHLKFENSAIATVNGQLNFYRLKQSDLPGLPFWYDQLGSFRKEVVLKHRNEVPHFDELFIEDKVQGITFSDLLKKHNVERLDVVHIDTEGYDFEILKMIPFPILDIDLVMFEHVHLDSNDYQSAKKILSENGYIVRKKGSDTIGVKKNTLKSIRSKIN